MQEETSTQTTEIAAQVADSGATVDTAVAGGEPAIGSWRFDESTVGTGDKPEWFKDSKYQSVADQAKAYTELEGRFGGFTGSPEEYTINDGVDYDADSPLFSKLQEIGKANNMSNDMFNNLISMYNESQDSAYEEAQAAELEALGSGAETRITSINDWSKANMPPELQDTFMDNLRTADDVRAVEHLINMTKEQRVASPSTAPAPTATTKAQLEEMQFEEDRYGNRRLATDPAFKKEYDRKMVEFYN